MGKKKTSTGARLLLLPIQTLEGRQDHLTHTSQIQKMEKLELKIK